MIEIISPFGLRQVKAHSLLSTEFGGVATAALFRFRNCFHLSFHFRDGYSIYHAKRFVKYGNAEKYEQNVNSCQSRDDLLTRRPYNDTIKSEEIAQKTDL